MPDRVSADTVLALLSDVVSDNRLALSVHTGSGLVASWPVAAARVQSNGGIATLILGNGTLRLDPSAVYWAELVVRPTPEAATCAFHLKGVMDGDVLRVSFPPEGTTDAIAMDEQVAYWEALASRYDADLVTRRTIITRQGPSGRASRELLLRLVTELRDSRRVVFDVPSPQSSAEVFPNVPLHNPHISEDGWLFLGEYERRDAHVHVHMQQLARAVFCEFQRREQTIYQMVRLTDDEGCSFVDCYFPEPYRDANLKRTPLNAESVQFFQDAYRRYAGERGVDFARTEVVRSPEVAAAAMR